MRGGTVRMPLTPIRTRDRYRSAIGVRLLGMPDDSPHNYLAVAASNLGRATSYRETTVAPSSGKSLHGYQTSRQDSRGEFTLLRERQDLAALSDTLAALDGLAPASEGYVRGSFTGFQE